MPDLYNAGLSSLKIEGRMKSIHYVATVTKVYREALDAYEADPEHFTVRQDGSMNWKRFPTGLIPAASPYRGRRKPTRSTANRVIPRPTTSSASSGLMTPKRASLDRTAEPLQSRPDRRILQPKGHLVRCTISSIISEEGEALDAARHPRQLVGLAISEALEPYSMMRRQVEDHA